MANVSDFADMCLQGTPSTSDMLSGEYHSIDDVINKVIIVTGVKADMDTANGSRTLVRFTWREGEAETAFFTSSKRLCKVLTDPNIQFPFATIIKVVIVRDMASFEFRSAREAVSQEDMQNLCMYQMQKRGYMKSRNK